MSGKNKNQTAMERARIKQEMGLLPSTHFCAADGCPNSGKPIPMGELYPVRMLLPKKHTVFYHRACGPRIAVGAN